MADSHWYKLQTPCQDAGVKKELKIEDLTVVEKFFCAPREVCETVFAFWVKLWKPVFNSLIACHTKHSMSGSFFVPSKGPHKQTSVKEQ